MTNNKMAESMKEMEDSIRYLQKRISVSQVIKVTDTILLKLCQAVYNLLEMESERHEDNA